MQIRTEEFMAMKVAIGIVKEHVDELEDYELEYIGSALTAILAAERRLAEANQKQAGVMRERRRKAKRVDSNACVMYTDRRKGE